MQLEDLKPQSTPTTYIALDDAIFPLGRIAIATQLEPHKQCGIARRIGYTDSSSHALPVYRLKVHMTQQTVMKTLAEFFVLEQGVFRAYD